MKTRRILVIALFAFLIATALRFGPKHVQSKRTITSRVVTQPAEVPAVMRSLRPNYPYSVIPGGAYSPAELSYAIQRDDLVRAHYAGFHLSSVRLVTLADDRYQYVSFRLHDRIYWTRNMLKIPKGEVLLTDGQSFARTRCGNRLSGTPVQQTTALQPPDRLLSLPPFQPQQLAQKEITLANAPPLGELSQLYPQLPVDLPQPPSMPAQPLVPIETSQNLIPIFTGPPFYGPVSGSQPPGGTPPVFLIPPALLPPPPLNQPPGVPGVPVPEPAGLYLFGAMMCVSLWFLTRMMRDHFEQQEPTEDETPLQP